MSRFPQNALSYSSFANEEFGNSSPEPRFLIRTARQQDLTTLADMLAQSFHTQDGLVGLMYPLLRVGIYEDLRTRLRSKAPYHACMVALKQPTEEKWSNPRLASYIDGADAVAGTVEIGLHAQTPWQPLSERYLYLSNLAVRKNYRRRGVASQLLLACERVALDWGYKDLYLHVLENNYAAQQLYAKAGYVVQRVEFSLSAWLLRQPRQLFLHKRLNKN